MDVNKLVGILLVVFSLILIIVIGIVKVNVDTQSEFLCDQIDKDPDLTMAQCPAHNNNNSWLFLIAFGVLFLGLGFGIYTLFTFYNINSFGSSVNYGVTTKQSKQHLSKDNDYKEIDLSSLDEEEKTIYDKIKEKEGSAYQSDLVKETQFSKVKITRVLDKLEHKGIIERKRRGMTNIVVLK